MKRLSICLLLAMICMAGYAQETEFTADRPGASTGPGVVGHRVIQLEQGLQYDGVLWPEHRNKDQVF